MIESCAMDSSSTLASGEKRIHRTTFKQDSPVTSYKCDFIASDITTPAKLYVSNQAFYVVHRPKRKKMTTIPFSEVSDIVPHTKNRCLDVRLTVGTVYTFANFQRPGHAVGFLVNFWYMVRKPKLLPKQSEVDGILRSSSDSRSLTSQTFKSNDSTVVQRVSIKPPVAQSRLQHLKTGRLQLSKTSWCSQNSFSATDSETDSRPTSSLKSSFNGSSNNQSYPTSDSRSNFFDFRNSRSTNHRGSRGSAQSLPNSVPSTPTSHPPPILKIPHSHEFASINDFHQSSFNETTDCRDGNASKAASNHPPAAAADPISQSIKNGQLLAKTRSQSAIRSWLSESLYRSIWPLNYLPHPLVSSPRRCTMLIAYSILIFLLLSTMHIYQRLAVFDLSDQPTLRRFKTSRTFLSNHEPISSNLFALESYLAQLADLTTRLSESMLKLSTEVQTMISDSPKVSHIDKSTPFTSPHT